MTVLQRISKLRPESWAYYELRQHKPRYDKEYSELLEETKQAGLNMENPNRMNVANMWNVRRVASQCSG
jgi:hypothetical protein